MKKEQPNAVQKASLKLALELGPLLVFFIANARFGIFTGTTAFVIATVVALLVSWLVRKEIPTLPLVSAFFVLLFGGLTIYLQDDLFIKLKPTLLNTLFGSALLFGYVTRRPYLKMLLGSALELEERAWLVLGLRWGLFFFLLAGLNEFIWRSFSTDTWVDFKVFGAMPLTILFSLTQLPYMMKNRLPDPEEEGDPAS